MATFSSDTGELVRVSGKEQEQRRDDAFAEVQLFGGDVMLTVKQRGKDDTANVVLDPEEASRIAQAIHDLARRSDELGDLSAAQKVSTVFGNNLQEYMDVDERFYEWLEA